MKLLFIFKIERISSSNDIPKKKKKKVVKQDMNKSDMCDASSNK